MVFGASMPLVSGGLPTTPAEMPPPLPFSPWQDAHFAAKIGAPCAGAPRPAGRLVPSGRMLMSHFLRSASAIGLPSPGLSAKAAPAAVDAIARQATKAKG